MTDTIKLKGTISLVNHSSKSGCIQGKDGKIYRFSFDDVKGDMAPALEMPVEFYANLDDAYNISLKVDDSFYESQTLFNEPQEVGLCAHGIPDGYELIASANRRLSFEHRKENFAKWGLINEVAKCGGNVVLDYKIEKLIKNSIGFSLYYYKVTGVPAVIGKHDPKGDLSLLDLKNRLDLKKIEKRYQFHESVKIGNKILKILGFILLVIFVIGFFVSP